MRAAPYDIILGPHDTFEPDLLFVREERWPMLMRDGRVYGPPDLCVEIASPSTREYDRTMKFERYAHFGVAEYWMVDPTTRTVEILALEGDAYIPLGVATGEAPVVSRVLPGLMLSATTVAADT